MVSCEGAKGCCLFEEILVDSLKVQDLLISTPNIVANHEVTKLLSIDQDDATADLPRCIHCALCEARGRHKDALLSFLQTKRTKKFADRSWPYKISIGISFCLNVDLIDAEWVLVNDAINAVIS